MPRGGGHRPGNRLWLPSDLGEALVGWYDANDIKTIQLASGVVSQMNDKSQYANHLTQATVGARPGWVSPTGAAPGYVDFTVNPPSMLISGATNKLPTGAAARTMVLAYTPQSVAAAAAYLGWGQNFGGNLCNMQNYNGHDPYFGGFSNDDDSLIAFASGVRMSASFSYGAGAATAMSLAKNGGTPITATNTLNTSTGTSLALGGSPSTTVATFTSGQQCFMHEAFILNIAADANLVARLQGYIHWHNKMQNLLPATHPYASAPPRFTF